MKPTDQKSLADVRSQIDALDRQILAAIEERAGLASAVVAAKTGRHVFRPGREADLIRALVASSSLPPLMIEIIWRQMIANNITSQQRLKIAMLDDPAVHAVAGFCFGTAIDSHEKQNARDVIEAVSSGTVDLGVMPHWQDDPTWLTDLGQTEDPVYIVAISPFLSGHQWAGQVMQDGVILSSSLPDPSSQDMTLYLSDGALKTLDGYHSDQSGLLGIIQKR